jgi:peptidoglycan-associated lipoprotein
MALLGACAGSESTQTQAQAPTNAEPTGVANVQPTSRPSAPPPSRVTISDEVLEACNIPKVDASFVFDSARLSTYGGATLTKVVQCFSSGPMVGHNLRIVGYADPSGPAEYGSTLGQFRADEVTGYLLAKGLNRTQATATSPLGAAPGSQEASWARDRRVDVMLER